MKKILFVLIFAISCVVTPVLATGNNGNREKKPIIGISATAGETSASAPLTYINSVKRAGGVPLVIPWTTDKDQIEKILEVIDGLVMTGGEDIDPLKYYGEEPVRAQGQIVPQRDEFDIMLIQMAVAKGLPVLGICRGHQIMNVAFGGSLYQDIPSQVKGTFVKHSQNAPRNYGTHTIDIEKNSKLHKILGLESVAVNTFHHQSVKDVARGFKITALSKDGVVEAMEKDGNQFVLGVQFHPEGFVSMGDDTFLPLFQTLIQESKK